jgi:hydroxymethylpyrimidine pyrophosphatase-like HAD family hydrolase
MDIGQYQKDRALELKKFRKEYSDLKSVYSQLLTQAVYETDTGKQAELVKQILSTNSGLAQHVREFVQSSRGKFDPALISELTADIIRYQKEFEAIQSASDKAVALQNILNKEKNQLNDLHSQFNIWLGVLLGAIVIILLLIFRTSLKQLSQAAENLMSSTSMTDSADWSDSTLPDEKLYRISPV